MWPSSVVGIHAVVTASIVVGCVEVVLALTSSGAALSSWVSTHVVRVTCGTQRELSVCTDNNNNNDRLTAFDPGQPG